MEKQADLTQLLQSRPQDCPCIFRYLYCLYPRAIRSIIALGSSLGSRPSTNPLAPDLAKALIQAGTVPDGTFWSGYLFDKALSHDIHNQVMADIEAQRGPNSDLNVHKILNQAMYDVAQALDMKKVKLAALN